ncbi:hypothetical protein SDJN03_26647, partial [Cucurbita argyrosperma subsp. sororia]
MDLTRAFTRCFAPLYALDRVIYCFVCAPILHASIFLSNLPLHEVWLETMAKTGGREVDSLRFPLQCLLQIGPMCD